VIPPEGELAGEDQMMRLRQGGCVQGDDAAAAEQFVQRGPTYAELGRAIVGQIRVEDDHLGDRLRHRLPRLREVNGVAPHDVFSTSAPGNAAVNAVASPGSSSTTTSASASSRATIAAPNTMFRKDGVAASTVPSFSALAEF
jgi:hypothetical protein